MSKISDIIDTMRTAISSVLTDHKELLNPYDPADADDLTLEKGWALAIRPGALASNREIGCRYSMIQNAEVVISRIVFAGSIITPTAIAERVSKEKSLLEDRHLVVQSFETNTQINSNGDIARCKFISDSGIEFVRVDETNVIMLRLNFEVEYFDELNS